MALLARSFATHTSTWYMLAAYALATAFYKLALHIDFDAHLIKQLMQFQDIELLHHDLLRTLWYQHTQPPLMNFMVGITLKIADSNYTYVLAIIYFLLGGAAMVWLDCAMQEVGIRSPIRILMGVWLCMHPAYLLYVNWGYTQHPECALYAALLYCLVRCARAEQLHWRDGIRLGIPSLLLGLIRPQWHLMIFAASLLIIIGLRWRVVGKRPFALGYGLMLSPILLICLKNLWVFGVFGASSWSGANLGQVAHVLVPPQELQLMKERGEISPWFPVEFNLDKAEKVRNDWIAQGRPVVDIDHPSLTQKYKANGAENNNYLPTLEGSKQDLEDSMFIIKRDPMVYVREVWARMNAVVRIPSAFAWLGPPWMQEYQRMFAPYRPWLNQGALWYYGYLPAFIVLLSLWPRSYWARQRVVIWVGATTALYIAITSSAFTYGGESDRMRWGMEPFYLMCFALLMEGIIRTFMPRKTPL